MFDSSYEEHFASWLDELQSNGIIRGYTQYPRFYLSKKLHNKKSILREHTYTADFKILWESNVYADLLHSDLRAYNKTPFISHNGISYVEIKPDYDFKNMTKLASVNIKWVYEKYGIVVNLIKPIGGVKCLFSTTFSPSSYAFTKRGKPRKTKFSIKLIDKWMNNAIQ